MSKALLFLLPALAAPPAAPSVEVRGARMHAREVFGPTAPDTDLGPTPPIGSSITIPRPEGFPKSTPAAVKVSRKAKHLDKNAIANAVKTVLAARTLPKNAKLVSVKAQAALDVPADFDHVDLDLPTLPRKAGFVTLPIPARFLAEDGTTLTTTLVSVELALPIEAATADVKKGSPVTLVIRRGLIEVSTPAVLGADADIGSATSVTLRPSGRVVRVRIIDKDHAVLEET